jgi:hypothetical protein
MKSPIVRTAIKIALVLLSWETLAVNKCDIDGKIVYQSSPCPPHAQKKNFEGRPVSVTNNAELREELENKKIEQHNSEITRLRLIAAKLELVKRGQWKESDEMSELKREVREAKEMAEDAAWDARSAKNR